MDKELKIERYQTPDGKWLWQLTWISNRPGIELRDRVMDFDTLQEADDFIKRQLTLETA